MQLTGNTKMLLAGLFSPTQWQGTPPIRKV
jgi:hypothetical protein